MRLNIDKTTKTAPSAFTAFQDSDVCNKIYYFEFKQPSTNRKLSTMTLTEKVKRNAKNEFEYPDMSILLALFEPSRF